MRGEPASPRRARYDGAAQVITRVDFSKKIRKNAAKNEGYLKVAGCADW
jgi:hypothetical protein